jgi:putative colanic acid biosynthesis acetyltransferase WcaF
VAEVNIQKNRGGRKYPAKIQLMRVVWAFGKSVFRVIPRPFYRPRRVLLRCFGAKIGRNVHISNTATIYFPWNLEVGDWAAIGEKAYLYNLGTIKIGDRSTISQGAHLCAGSHDYQDPSMPLLKPPIRVGSQVWICADAFLGPNVSVGEGAVVGARAVVCRDVDPWTVVAGNPATFIKKREIRK